MILTHICTHPGGKEALIRFTNAELEELSKPNEELIAEENLKNFYKIQARKAAMFDEILSRLK